MSSRLTDVYVVTHTHWDREWYQTADAFRQRLVRLIDDVIDDPPAGDASFLLDGQAVLIEDYLTVRPDRAAELSAPLRDGRLEAGPWYVLADELIPSGEALVRNLLAGRETLSRLRCAPPPVLYCPDSFGHPAILPDLAAGFGCTTIVLWRGYGGRRWPAGDVVRWRGSAGGSALVCHLPPDGYESGSALPVKQSESHERWTRIASVLAPRASTGTAILMNGADHHARQHGLPDALAMMRSFAAPVRIHSSSLRTAAHALGAAAEGGDIAEIAGELRDSYGYTWTLQGTLGTRAAQKRKNARAERLLVRDVEPWVALSSGDETTHALLTMAWRTLLQVHPHDTLCGTSIDAVADAFEHRVASVDVQSHALRRSSLLALLRHDVERARLSQAEWKPAVVIGNPAARKRGGVVELRLSATIADVAVGPGSADRQGVRRPLPVWQVNGVAVQVLDQRERVALTESPRAYPDADIVADARAVGWMNEIGGYTVVTRLHGDVEGPVVPNPVTVTGRVMENGLVRIAISDSGDVSLEDLVSGRLIPCVVRIERARDVGDLYTPAIRETLAPPIVRDVYVAHRGPIRGEIAIDFAFSAARGETASACRLSICLDANSRAMKVVVTGENADVDQRLRLCFETALVSATTVADAAFHPVVRTPLAITDEDARMEHVVPTAPLHRWVARFSADTGAVIVSDGLAEYESLNGGGVAITVVRSVGELSRADLPERPGHAGWPASTPGAQCPGPYEAAFAFQLMGGDSLATRMEIEQLAEDILSPLTGETLRSNLGDECIAGGLELIGEGLVFSATMPAQRRGWTTVRCVNQRDSDVQGAWHFARPIAEAETTRLDETAIESLRPEGNVVRFSARPRAIVTILVRYAAPRHTGHDDVTVE